MNTFISIIIGYAVYFLISSTIEAIVLIKNTLSRKTTGIIGSVLTFISMFFWTKFGSGDGVLYYAGAILLSLNLILCGINAALGILGCDARNC